MNGVPVLFAAALSLHLAWPAAGQDSAEPAPPPVQRPEQAIEQNPPVAVTPDRDALRKRLVELKAQRAEAIARASEARKAFNSSQVELKIKVSHLRAARVERDKEKAAALEKEVGPLREEVRARRQSMLDALEEAKRLRTETRAAAEALGRADKGKG